MPLNSTRLVFCLGILLLFPVISRAQSNYGNFTNTSTGTQVTIANTVVCYNAGAFPAGGGTSTLFGIWIEVVSGGPVPVQLALYSGTSAPFNLVSSTASFNVNANPAGYTTPFSQALTAGTTYILCANSSGSVNGTYNAASGTSYFVGQAFGTWPSTISPSSFTGSAYIWIVYTPSGGGSTSGFLLLGVGR